MAGSRSPACRERRETGAEAEALSEEELRPQLVGDLVDLVDLNGHVLAALDSPVHEARDREGHVLAGKEEHQRVGSGARLKSVLGTSIY